MWVNYRKGALLFCAVLVLGCQKKPQTGKDDEEQTTETETETGRFTEEQTDTTDTSTNRDDSVSSEEENDTLDSGTEGDTESATEGDTEKGTDSGDETNSLSEFCDAFPPNNPPDGCRRILLSQNSQGEPFIAAAANAVISRDGTVAAFVVTPSENTAEEAQLISGDTNGDIDDIYAVDLQTMEMEIISTNTEGTIGDGGSENPILSADGRYVAFNSTAGNFSSDDANSTQDVFVKDRETGELELISRASGKNGEVGNSFSQYPIISADARYVVFYSEASNLVPGDTNETSDLFLRDRQEHTTERITVTDSGEQVSGNVRNIKQHGARGISDDGRFVLFDYSGRLSPLDDHLDSSSYAERNDIYLRDRLTGKNLIVGLAPDGYHRAGHALFLSPDGQTVGFQTGNAGHFADVSDHEFSTTLILAHKKDDSFTFEPVYVKGCHLDVTDYPNYTAISLDMNEIVFRNHSDCFVKNVGNNPDRLIDNVFMYNRESEEFSLITASEAGTPGIVPAYYELPYELVVMADWVDMAMSGDGKRTVFSTIQHGIVDVPELECINLTHRVYLRDCR